MILVARGPIEKGEALLRGAVITLTRANKLFVALRVTSTIMNIHRRSILRTLLGSGLGLGLAGLGTIAALWGTAVARFLTPNVSKGPRGTFKAGLPADYRDGCVDTKHRQSHGVWIVRDTRQSRSRIYALHAACTHLGCLTVWHESQQQFRCPCHGSVFTKEGRNIAGPAPWPLERCAIRIAEDGQIEIDTGRTFRADGGEAERPESYVEA
jgi:cytochrome b6-f complex iron-sulfur subunit